MRKLQVSEWGSIAEVVTAIAVVISLIYVGLEVHRNTLTQVQASTQALITDINRSYESIAEDAELSCIYLRGQADFSGLSAHEKVRFSAFSMMALRSLEDLHTQWLEGLVDKRIWTGFDRQMSEFAQSPGFSQWWAIRRQFFNDEFQAFWESKIAEKPTSKLASFGAPNCTVPS
jgi:hypothetical protein